MAKIPGKFWSHGEFPNAHYDWRSQHPFSRIIVLSSPVPDDFRPSLVPGSGSHSTLGVKQKHRQPAQLPVATRLSTEVLCLPFFGGLSDDDAHRICDAIDWGLGGPSR